MTDKVQLIKEEIERQIEEGKVKCQQSQENNDHESLVAWSEHVATCGKLLVFINSLPEEPINEDLEEEIENYINDSLAIKFPTTDKEQIKADIRYIAHHFAEWQKYQKKEDIQTEYDKGRFNMKEEIMKNAVDATVLDVDAQTVEFGLWPEKLLSIKEGDKVKIIIIREE